MKKFFLFLILLNAKWLAAQGPLDGYMKGKGVLDLAPSFSWMNANDFAGANDQIYDTGYRGQLLSVFAEYGVTDNFDVVATIPFVFTADQQGLQDGGLYVKYRPVYAKLGDAGHLGVLAAMGASFPLSDYEPTNAGALGQRAVAVPARLIAQWDSPFGVFFNLTGGYNWRLDQLKDADIAIVRQRRPDYQPIDPPGYLTLLTRVGLPLKKAYFDAWAEWQRTSGGADYVPDVPDLPQAYGVSYTQVGGTAYFANGTRGGVVLSGAYIVGGRNVSRIARITIGIVVKMGNTEKKQ